MQMRFVLVSLLNKMILGKIESFNCKLRTENDIFSLLHFFKNNLGILIKCTWKIDHVNPVDFLSLGLMQNTVD